MSRGRPAANPPLGELDPFPKRGRLDVVIETPKGSRNKFKYDTAQDVFRLGKQLPAGAVFPFDFGFVPRTLAEDGDPLDVLVLLDQPAFPGCVVRTRPIGLIDAEQTGRSGRTARNPRLIAVATKSTEQRRLHDLSELPDVVVAEIEHFFASYNAASGRTFQLLGRHDHGAAERCVAAGARAFERRRRTGKTAADQRGSEAKPVAADPRQRRPTSLRRGLRVARLARLMIAARADTPA